MKAPLILAYASLALLAFGVGELKKQVANLESRIQYLEQLIKSF